MRGSWRKSVLLVASSALFAFSLVMGLLGIWFVDDLTLTTPYYATSIMSGGGGLYFARLQFDYTQPEWEIAQGTRPRQPDSAWHISFVQAVSGRVDDYVGWTTAEALAEKPSAGGWGCYFFAAGAPLRWSIAATPAPQGWMLRVPWWLIILLSGILPSTFLYRLAVRVKPHRKGYCQYCGYDLRATPDRCPECGMVNKR
jgi:hypothetical protein